MFCQGMLTIFSLKYTWSLPFCRCFIENLTSKVVTLSHHVHFYLVDSLALEKNKSSLTKVQASRSSLSEYLLASPHSTELPLAPS